MRIAVLGVGLIGGSVGLASRRRLGAEVVGWDPDPAARHDALERGALDRALEGPDELDAVELIVVASPVAALASTVAAACAAADLGAVVTDVGSVKAALVARVAHPAFIGGHPLAGAETAGVAGAREDLFDGATWYLTPQANTSGERFERLHRFVAGLGAVPTTIDAADHDRVMAAVSHLPHVLANLLVEAGAGALGGEAMPAVGPSFRDATRVAGANPTLWGQIYAENAGALGVQLDAVLARLTHLRGRLDDLEGWQRQVAEQRTALLAAVAPGARLVELRVHVVNRPGIVAELALTLGRAGVNIHDLSLTPAADDATGTVALWVAEGEADTARRLIAEKGHPTT